MSLIERLCKNNLTLLAVLLGVLLGGTIGLLMASRYAPETFHPQLQLPVSADNSDDTPHLLHGKIASLSWIVGQDCQRGLQAYLHTADLLPDAALVGTGWLHPTNGKLITGKSNNCVAKSASMDAVVRLIHSHGGMAYLTLTMMTDGTTDAWTSQQQAEYITKATTTQSYIDIIVHEVLRANYDGVIMDLESTPPDYPAIQQSFALYNQHLWATLKAHHKLYGIALVHKVSNHDSYYILNGFQDWRLLAHSADFMVIMALDQSYATPGPSVSLPWLKQILAYAQQTMPDMLPDIIWELPLYGNSWHQANEAWVFDGLINYQEAQHIHSQVDETRIDTSASNLDGATDTYLIYSDEAGVKHALWYHTARNLYTIITAFSRTLEETSEFGTAVPQIAVWYRSTQEPGELWPMLATSLLNSP
ncbi:hypothetical protein [Reticulibacter mediterranei]|nr:hypothetical protein [Reticulibacter mediterranei]